MKRNEKQVVWRHTITLKDYLTKMQYDPLIKAMDVLVSQLKGIISAETIRKSHQISALTLRQLINLTSAFQEEQLEFQKHSKHHNDSKLTKDVKSLNYLLSLLYQLGDTPTTETVHDIEKFIYVN
jgi:hypothetical protein